MARSPIARLALAIGGIDLGLSLAANLAAHPQRPKLAFAMILIGALSAFGVLLTFAINDQIDSWIAFGINFAAVLLATAFLFKVM